MYAPSVVPDEERAAIITMVSVTVKEALLLGGPASPAWIGFGAEDRVALTVEPALADALDVDGARVDAAPRGTEPPAGGDGREPEPDRRRRPTTLVTIGARRACPTRAGSGPTFDAIRIGVGFEQLAWLASRDVEVAAPQAPTATGTLE